MYRKVTLVHSWWECKAVQALWKTVWKFFKNLKTEPPYDSAIPLMENPNSKKYMSPDVHNSIIYNCQDMEETYVSFNRKTDKEDMVYIHNEILLGHKKIKFSTCSNMDGLGGHYAKWNKSDGQMLMISLLYGI